MAGLAVLSTALAFVLFFRTLERIGPVRTQSVTYLVPAFGMLWGSLFLGEEITSGMLAGFALIIASMLMINGIGAFGQRVLRPARALARRGLRPAEPAVSGSFAQRTPVPLGEAPAAQCARCA
jgi:hypothetical protein